MMHGRYRYGSIRAGRPVGYAVHAFLGENKNFIFFYPLPRINSDLKK